MVNADQQLAYERVILRQRNAVDAILDRCQQNPDGVFLDILNEYVDDLVEKHASGSNIDLDTLGADLPDSAHLAICSSPDGLSEADIKELLIRGFYSAYRAQVDQWGRESASVHLPIWRRPSPEDVRRWGQESVTVLMIGTLNEFWQVQMEALDDLLEMAGTRLYSQLHRDSEAQFRREAFALFRGMLTQFNNCLLNQFISVDT